MSDMNTVQQQWEKFDTLLVPKNAPAIQRQEMQRSFYSGVNALLILLNNMGDVSEEAATAMLEGWHDECERFMQLVVDGKA